MKAKPDPQTRYKPRHAWYMPDALLFVRALQATVWPLQHHVALGGGVVNHGYSDKDLDVYVLPLYGRDEDAQRTVRAIQNTTLLPAIAYAIGSTAQLDYHGSQDAGAETCFHSSLRYEDTEGRHIDVFVVRA